MFIVNFEQIPYIVLVFIVDFKQVITNYEDEIYRQSHSQMLQYTTNIHIA